MGEVYVSMGEAGILHAYIHPMKYLVNVLGHREGKDEDGTAFGLPILRALNDLDP